MNYIYDIILNFNTTLYDFYEWNKNDKFTFIRRIPLFLVDKKIFDDIVNYKVNFDISFLEKIENKTEIKCGKNKKNIKYALLLTDGFNVIAIKIENKMLYSSLQIEDELDILEKLPDKKTNINYSIKKENKREVYKTRKEIEKIKMIKKELSKLKNEKNYPKIKYIYYECFGELETNIDKIFLNLDDKLLKQEILLKLDKLFLIIN